MSNFSERLSELMFEKNLNAVSLGLAVGIEHSTISGYLRGEGMPTLATLIVLADYFQCSTDFLLGLEENYPQTYRECPPFSERIRVVLKAYGKSQYAVEKACKISHSVFGYWVAGKTQPSPINLMKIAAYLGCTVDYLIGRTT